jgi:hypothetical protein
MAVHGGAWVRHHTSRLVDLFLLLEHAIVSRMEFIEQVMVRAPLEAKAWHLVGHARNHMLSNAFSALPILLPANSAQWMLLYDEAIVHMVSGKGRAERDELLSKTIESAIASGELRLRKAQTCRPRDSIAEIAKRTMWPQLVVDENLGFDRLLGIVTPFDLL